MSGHLFVIRADLTRLACDAWLLPTDLRAGVGEHWQREMSQAESPGRGIPERLSEIQTRLPHDWSNEGSRVVAFYEHPDFREMPQPYLVNVGGLPGFATDWYLEGVRQFLEAVKRAPATYPARHERDRPLIALPVVGTGAGGAHAIKGEMLTALVRLLHQAAKDYGFDIALVAREPRMYAAAQVVRQRLAAREDGLWAELNDTLRIQASALAAQAKNGNLVLFIGAGVSRAAGLPSWDELLLQLAKDVGVEDPRSLERFSKLNYLDQAVIVERRAKDRSVGDLVALRLTSRHYSLGHALLASLPTNETITTNYDRLFESAAEDGDNPVAVLPENHGGGKRWLLKMHGCITRPEDIVLTREDYLRYAHRRGALAGIVQAMLLTRHMLFVGFSLSDDNFYRIADDVRMAVRGAHQRSEGHPFGTALVLSRTEFQPELWEGDLSFVSVSDTAVSDTAAARLVDIFLDLVACEASDSSPHLLAADFEGMLTSEERALKEHLTRLIQEAPIKAKRAPEWQSVSQLLRDLGLT